MIGTSEISWDCHGASHSTLPRSDLARNELEWEDIGTTMFARNSRIIAALVMLVAAACEVGGDAMIRAGLRGRGIAWCALGAVTLAAYGVVVNLIPMDFSRLLGTYVAFFAVVSVCFGKVLFGETVPSTTWIGLGVVLVGSAIIQVGVGE